MIQVMHTVADYVHDAKYKMPDRPLPCFYQGLGYSVNVSKK